MKEKKLLRALGNVDNQYIKEAEPMKKTSRITNRQKWVSGLCFGSDGGCFCVVPSDPGYGNE